jgi:hypothetical protein
MDGYMSYMNFSLNILTSSEGEKENVLTAVYAILNYYVQLEYRKFEHWRFAHFLSRGWSAV